MRPIVVACAFFLIAPVSASGQATFLYFNSQPGETLGGGQQFTLTLVDGTISAYRPDGGVNVEFNGSKHWDLYFVAPHEATLVPGIYEAAQRWPFQSPLAPGLSVSGAGNGCTQNITGRFVVLEAVYGAGGTVQSFAADYEMHCAGSPGLFGSVRINSTVAVSPRLSVDSVSVYEGSSGTTAVFTVSLSIPSSSTITVNYATADGTALAGSDYGAVAGSLTFPPSITARTVSVPILDDTVSDGSEFFRLNLSSPTNATLAHGQGTGTIVDNEGPLTFLYFSSQPGDIIGQGQQFTLTPLGGIITTSRQDSRVYVRFDGGAEWELDFVAANSAPLIPGVYEGALGAFSQSAARPGLAVSGANRRCSTLNGRFVVLEAVYAGSAVQSFAADYEQHCNGAVPALFGSVRINSTVTVIPRLSVDSVSTSEGDSGTTSALFTVSLSAPSTSTVTVDYATADGTALAGSDYQSVAGALTFTPGVTARTVSVPIYGDTVTDGSEAFFLNLSSPANANLAHGQGTGTIVDDDGPKTFLYFNSQAGDRIGQGQQFTLKPSDAPITTTRHDGGVRVFFDTSDWWELDFVAPHSATLVPGVYEGAVRWRPLRDPNRPGLSVSGRMRGNCSTLTGRFVVLEAVYGAGGAVQSFAVDYEQHCEGAGPALFGSVRINSNFAVAPRLSVDRIAFYEGHSGTTDAMFIASLSAPVASPVTVSYATADASAVAGSDYQPVSGTLTFPPSVTALTVAVPIVGDTVPEGDELFLINLTSPTNATLSFGQGTATIVEDEGPRTLLQFASQPGDTVGQGQQLALTPLDGAITAVFQNGAVNVHFNGEQFWDLAFAAPNSAPPVPGVYEVAQIWPYHEAQPGLRVFGEFTGCNTIKGRFVVLEAMYGPGNAVVRFAADYEQHCQGAAPALFGYVRINSSVEVGPRLSVNSVGLSEGDFGTSDAVFTVSLWAPSTNPVAVAYATADATATAGSDYQAVAGTLTFPPSITSRTVTVPIMGGTVAEGDEFFWLNLTSPSNATLAFGPAKGTILDNEGRKTFLSFDSQAGDYVGGGKQFVFTPLDGLIGPRFSYFGPFQDGGVHLGFRGSEWWSLDFVAPYLQTLVPGVYEEARRWPFQCDPPGIACAQPALDVAGDGRGCNVLSGRFVVLEAVYGAGGAVQSFAADYEQHCEGGSAALHGSVRINSSVPVGSADLSIATTDGVESVLPGGGLSYSVVVSNAGPDPVTGATVTDTFPATLACSTTCSGTGGATCTPGPIAGNIADKVTIPAGHSVTYTSSCTVSASATGTLVNTATVTAPVDVTDPNIANNIATDVDAILLATATALLSSTVPALPSESVTLTANVVPPTATGLVTFRDGATTLGTGAVVAGRASLTSAFTRYGAHAITAVYSGDANHGPSTSPVLVQVVSRPTTDFSGNGLGGLIWRHPASGALELFGFDGTTWARISLGGSDPSLRIVGYGDFDGDLRSDILMRHASNGRMYIVLMGGSAGIVTAFAPLTWQIDGIGDLDGNGKADLVWRDRETGNVFVWLMDGLTVLSQGFVGSVLDGVQIRAVADLDGDGRADILWKDDTSGQVYGWLMHGASIASGGPIVPVAAMASSRQIVAVADMNGDGKADVVWRENISGELRIWMMNGLNQEFEADVANPPPASWDVMQVDDVDGDGKGDIAFHDQATGNVLVWKMDGAVTVREWYLGNDPDLRWDVVGRRSLGDGRSDLVWWHEGSGLLHQWLLDGPRVKAAAGFGQVPDTNWRIVGVGDLNGDSRDDLVWRHQTDGTVLGLLLDGPSVRARGALGQVDDLSWRIVGMGDTNGDGRDDIIWRHDSFPDVYAWQTNGLSGPAAVNLGSRESSWALVGVRDVDADGKDDMVWYQSSTGTLEAWLMNGASHTTWTVGTKATPWAPVGLADINGDGRSDVVWLNGETGDLEFWLLAGGSYTTAPLVRPDPAWALAAVGDTNGDGLQDLVWRHRASGEIQLWLMNGPYPLGGGPLPAVADPAWKIVGTVR